MSLSLDPKHQSGVEGEGGAGIGAESATLSANSLPLSLLVRDGPILLDIRSEECRYAMSRGEVAELRAQRIRDHRRAATDGWNH